MSLNYHFDSSTSYPQGEDLLSSLEYLTPREDKTLRSIAKFLADGLNHAFIQVCPEEICVRDILDYDAVNPDLSRFPLLKVYRQTDSFPESKERRSECVIAYCVAFPDQDKLPGLLQWVSIAIDELLSKYTLLNQHCRANVVNSERKAEYRIMVNEVATPVYAFLRVNFAIVEY